MNTLHIKGQANGTVNASGRGSGLGMAGCVGRDMDDASRPFVDCTYETPITLETQFPREFVSYGFMGSVYDLPAQPATTGGTPTFGPRGQATSVAAGSGFQTQVLWRQSRPGLEEPDERECWGKIERKRELME